VCLVWCVPCVTIVLLVNAFISASVVILSGTSATVLNYSVEASAVTWPEPGPPSESELALELLAAELQSVALQDLEPGTRTNVDLYVQDSRTLESAYVSLSHSLPPYTQSALCSLSITWAGSVWAVSSISRRWHGREI
jgi:hypothetical protein